MYAIAGKQFDTITYLIDVHKVNINYSDKYNGTCFDMLWQYNYKCEINFLIRVVTKLVESGYNIKLCNLCNTVISKCHWNDCQEICTNIFVYLVEKSQLTQNDLNELLISITRSQKGETLVLVKYLVEIKNASVIYVNNAKRSAVVEACDVEIIKYLVGKGANINLCIDKFVNYCYEESYEGFELLKCYKECGINVNLKGNCYGKKRKAIDVCNDIKDSKMHKQIHDLLNDV